MLIMKKKITIPKPCHENWGSMTPEEKGRHCGVCNKVVVDFTKKTKEEALDILEQAEGKTCGRFRIDQISRPKVPVKAAAAVSAITILSFSAVAQGGVEEPRLVGEVVLAQHHVIANHQLYNITGKILTTNERGINAKVSFLSNGKIVKSVLSTTDGSFNVELHSDQLTSSSIDIKVFAKRYETKLLESITLTKQDTTFNIYMGEQHFLMGKVACPAPEPIDELHPKGDVKIIETPVEHPKGNIQILEEEMGDVMLEEYPEEQIKDSEPINELVPIEQSQEVSEPVQELHMLGQVISVVEPEIVNAEAEITNIPEEELEIIKSVATDVEVLPIEESSPKNPVEVSENPGFKLTTYPNPSRGVFTLQTSNQGTHEYKILDMNGRVLDSGLMKGQFKEFDLTKEAPGIYLVAIYEKDNLKGSGRIMIQ